MCGCLKVPYLTIDGSDSSVWLPEGVKINNVNLYTFQQLLVENVFVFEITSLRQITLTDCKNAARYT